MPKIIFDTRNEIPEHLQAEAKEMEDGKFELDASGVLNKNKELLSTNATLKRRAEDAETAKAAADAERDEYKTKPNIPKGQRLVSIEDAELVSVVKAEGLTKESIPELKKSSEKLSAIEMERINEKVSDAIGKERQAWLDHSRANNLRFDTRKETVDGKEQEYFVVLGADNSETKLTDYVAAKAAHVKDAVEQPQGKVWGKQISGKDTKPPNLVEQEVEAAIATGRYNL